MLIPTKKNVKTITDMRENALGVLKDVEDTDVAYIFHHSKPRAVILSMDEFLRLKEIEEDLEDIEIARQISKEKRGKGTPIEEVFREYGL